MKEVKLQINEVEKVLNIPTSVEEISDEYLKTITERIKVADNYSLIAIVAICPLNDIILNVKRNADRENRLPAIPLFIKSGKASNEFNSNIAFKNQVIVGQSQLVIAHSAVAKDNYLSFGYVCNAIHKDTTIGKRMEEFTNVLGYFVDFKIVPNCDIVGYYSK